MDDHDTAVLPFLAFHRGSSVAGPAAVEQQSQHVTVEADGVVVSHVPPTLEAECVLEGDPRRDRAIGRSLLGRFHAEPLVVAPQEVLEHLVGIRPRDAHL